MIVEFPFSKPDVIFAKLRKLGNFDYEPCSYPEYESQLQQSQPILITNRFEALGEIDDESLLEAVTTSMSLDIDDFDPNEQSVEGDIDDTSDEWTTIVRRKPGTITSIKKRRETPCKWGDHCVKAADCPYHHTEYEKKLFTRYPKLKFR